MHRGKELPPGRQSPSAVMVKIGSKRALLLCLIGSIRVGLIYDQP